MPDRRTIGLHTWMFCFASDQRTLEESVPNLLACRCRAQVLGLVLEPLLGPVDLGFLRDLCVDGGEVHLRCEYPHRKKQPPPIDWVIVGGESGRNRRPCEIEWFVEIAEQCEAAGVPVFVKQDSALKPGQQGRIPGRLWALKQVPEVSGE